MRLTDLEARLATDLGSAVHVVATSVGRANPILSPAEQVQFDSLEFEQRRAEWILGRTALKGLLKSLGRDDDTSMVQVFDRQVSISHSDGVAIAVGTTRSHSGIGVDFERFRPVRPGFTSWFLNDAELKYLRAKRDSDTSNQTIRLWTIKEAAFKCHPENRGRVMRDFTIDHPGERVCSIKCSDGKRFRAVTYNVAGGLISIAIPGESHAH